MSLTASPQASSALTFQLRRFWRLWTANPKVTAGCCIVGFFILLAVSSFFITRDPNAVSADALLPPSPAHWLGTTQTGQDVFTQMVVGSRTSLLAGFVVGIISTGLSLLIGLTAGYCGGIIDDILSLLMNIFLVIPGMPLAIVLAAYSPIKGPLPVIVVLAVTGWAWNARIIRAQTLSLRQRDFVEAARSNGENPFRLIFAEILPNETALVMVGLIGAIIYAILAEAGLEFLGLGDPTVMSWGAMFYWAENNNALLVGAWWWFLPPGLCIALLGAGLTLMNFGLDEIANPRLRVEPRPGKRKARAETTGEHVPDEELAQAYSGEAGELAAQSGPQDVQAQAHGGEPAM